MKSGVGRLDRTELEVLERIDDPSLDQSIEDYTVFHRGGLGPWSIAQISGSFPSGDAIAREVYVAKDWKEAFYFLSMNDQPNEAWFEPGDAPPLFSRFEHRLGSDKELERYYSRRRARGPVWLAILRRHHYPGWSYQLDDASEHPVLKVNCGLQAVPLLGSGTRQITFHYHPTGLPQPPPSHSLPSGAAFCLIRSRIGRAIKVLF